MRGERNKRERQANRQKVDEKDETGGEGMRQRKKKRLGDRQIEKVREKEIGR